MSHPRGVELPAERSPDHPKESTRARLLAEKVQAPMQGIHSPTVLPRSTTRDAMARDAKPWSLGEQGIELTLWSAKLLAEKDEAPISYPRGPKPFSEKSPGPEGKALGPSFSLRRSRPRC
jgi:hypothetical protein